MISWYILLRSFYGNIILRQHDVVISIGLTEKEYDLAGHVHITEAAKNGFACGRFRKSSNFDSYIEELFWFGNTQTTRKG